MIIDVDKLHIAYKNGKHVTYPVSAHTKTNLNYKVAVSSNTLSSYVRSVLKELGQKYDIDPEYSQIEVEARKRDQDVRGFLDSYFRENCKLRSSEWMKMVPIVRAEYIRFARQYPSVAATWCVNVMMYVYHDIKNDTLWDKKFTEAVEQVKEMI